MLKHLYYKLCLQPLSPFIIGSGQEYSSDIDIVRDSLNRPYIPGTSLAGVLRSLADNPVELFGNVTINTSDEANEGEKAIPSKVYVYDGLLPKNVNGSVEIRDNVALDEWKTAQKKAKFEYEICDSTEIFTSYLEVNKNNYTNSIESEIETLLGKLHAYEYGLGGKTGRGFGRFSLTTYKKTFDFCDPIDIEKWLKFDMFANAVWADIAQVSLNKVNNNYTVLTVPLELRGGISIRRYTTEVGENTPDYEHLKCKDKPIIPGTSWSGAFRSRINEFLKGKKGIDTDLWFGKLGEKSLIVFEESEIVGGRSKVISRNSIDRFSAATKERSLYTERTHWGGTTALTIRFPSNLVYPKSLLKPLIYACVLDLLDGMLPVGGLTSVGRGVFKQSSKEKIMLNGEKIELDMLKEEVQS